MTQVKLHYKKKVFEAFCIKYGHANASSTYFHGAIHQKSNLRTKIYVNFGTLE